MSFVQGLLRCKSGGPLCYKSCVQLHSQFSYLSGVVDHIGLQKAHHQFADGTSSLLGHLFACQGRSKNDLSVRATLSNDHWVSACGEVDKSVSYDSVYVATSNLLTECISSLLV